MAFASLIAETLGEGGLNETIRASVKSYFRSVDIDMCSHIFRSGSIREHNLSGSSNCSGHQDPVSTASGKDDSSRLFLDRCDLRSSRGCSDHETGKDKSAGALNRSRLILSFTVILTLFVCAVSLTPPMLNHTIRPDGMYYAAVADWNTKLMLAPWCFRLLTPALARGLEATGIFEDPFKAVAYPAVLLTCFVLFSLLLTEKISISVATAMTALYAFSYPSRKLLNQVSTADPLAMLLLAAGVMAILNRRFQWFGLITLFGVMNREVAFLLIPVAYVYWADKPWDWQSIRKLSWTIPAFGMFFLIRAVVPSVQHIGFVQFYLDPYYLKECYTIQGGLSGMIMLAYSTFGILWLIAFLEAVRSRDRLTWSFGLLTITCFMSLFFAHNTSREMMTVFPFLFLLVARFASKFPGAFVVVATVSLLQSMIKFAPMSGFHPQWLLMFPIPAIRALEFSVFLFVLIFIRQRPGQKFTS
jgi:hypothetical protein